jgi:hypothetical protein
MATRTAARTPAARLDPEEATLDWLRHRDLDRDRLLAIQE